MSAGARGTGHASGKVILLGEHAVVYGVPALAAGYEKGARAEATLLEAGEPSRLQMPGTSDPGADRAFAALLAEGGALPAMSVEASADLPPGAGLGCSAALGVAIARAAITASGRVAEDAEVIARANAWERVFHSNPSGIDVSAAALGGCFRFTRAEGARPIGVARDLVLCVGLTGESVSTAVMVDGVARFRERWRDVFDRNVAGIAAAVENAALAIQDGDLPALGKLMNMNQMMLAGLMLSSEKLEELIGIARGAGALGAKLTGKGGGGAVIALVTAPEEAEPVLAAWRRAGYEGFSTCVSARTVPS